jgi:glycosyltransferase involved in cell wall biosynthesis
MSRIAVMTAGHPSTCPRMLKAADALSAAGHDVRLICTGFVDWAAAADRDVLASRRWRTTVVNYARATAPLRSRWVGARRRVALTLAGNAPSPRRHWWAVTRAYSYVHPELVRAALAEPADYFYGGTTGALAAVAEAAVRASRPFGVDLEDLHTAESTEPDAPRQHALAARIEARVLPEAGLRTTSSEAIAEAYADRYGLTAEVIHNVFPLPARSRRPSAADGPLRCYWFSQTIGPGRGLEEFVDAAGLAGAPMRLTLQGRSVGHYVDGLKRRAAAAAPALAIDVTAPVSPDSLIQAAAAHDIGLSLELPLVENRDRNLPNKLFTYLAAGLAVIATATRGQRWIADSLGDAVAWWTPGDPRPMADWLSRWDGHRAALAAARQASWRAAASRWHWGHPSEGPRLVSLIESAMR